MAVGRTKAVRTDGAAGFTMSGLAAFTKAAKDAALQKFRHSFLPFIFSRIKSALIVLDIYV